MGFQPRLRERELGFWPSVRVRESWIFGHEFRKRERERERVGISTMDLEREREREPSISPFTQNPLLVTSTFTVNLETFCRGD